MVRPLVSRPMQVHSPRPQMLGSALLPLPLVGYLDKPTRWRLSGRQRTVVVGSCWGPWAVHRSWSSWGKGSRRCSDWGSRRPRSPHRGWSLSGGTCVWCQGSPGLLQTPSPHQRAAASPAPYWFSAHLPRWCQGTSGCRALCIRHRDWGWSLAAVFPGTQRGGKGSEFVRPGTTTKKRAAEAGTTHTPTDTVLVRIVHHLIDAFKDQMTPRLTMPEFSPQPKLAVPLTCISQCWSQPMAALSKPFLDLSVLQTLWSFNISFKKQKNIITPSTLYSSTFHLSPTDLSSV